MAGRSMTRGGAEAVGGSRGVAGSCGWQPDCEQPHCRGPGHRNRAAAWARRMMQAFLKKAPITSNNNNLVKNVGEAVADPAAATTLSSVLQTPETLRPGTKTCETTLEKASSQSEELEEEKAPTLQRDPSESPVVITLDSSPDEKENEQVVAEEEGPKASPSCSADFATPKVFSTLPRNDTKTTYTRHAPPSYPCRACARCPDCELAAAAIPARPPPSQVVAPSLILNPCHCARLMPTALTEPKAERGQEGRTRKGQEGQRGRACPC